MKIASTNDPNELLTLRYRAGMFFALLTTVAALSGGPLLLEVVFGRRPSDATVNAISQTSLLLAGAAAAGAGSIFGVGDTPSTRIKKEEDDEPKPLDKS
jgi:hypothetical protein